MKWEHEPRKASFSTQFWVLPNFHACFYNVMGTRGGNIFYFFYKITRRNPKRGNSLLYQSVNSPYHSRWRMRWRIIAWLLHVFHTVIAFSQSNLTFSKCYFINWYGPFVSLFVCLFVFRISLSYYNSFNLRKAFQLKYWAGGIKLLTRI